MQRRVRSSRHVWWSTCCWPPRCSSRSATSAVWRKLTGALDGMSVAKVTAAALWQARTRLGPRRCGPCSICCAAAPPRRARAGSWWRGRLVCAIDGTTLDVRETPGHRARLGNRITSTPPLATRRSGWSRSWPAEPGPLSTRSSAPAADGEPAYLTRLLGSLHSGMIVLLDRGLPPMPCSAPSPPPTRISWPG